MFIEKTVSYWVIKGNSGSVLKSFYFAEGRLGVWKWKNFIKGPPWPDFDPQPYLFWRGYQAYQVTSKQHSVSNTHFWLSTEAYGMVKNEHLVGHCSNTIFSGPRLQSWKHWKYLHFLVMILNMWVFCKTLKWEILTLFIVIYDLKEQTII